jgi:hypothetical protein
VRRQLVLPCLLLVLTATGCGGDDADNDSADSTASHPASHTASASSEPSGGLTVTDGITSEELVSCLTDAGLDATATDSVPFGVEVPVVEVEVTGMTDYEGGTGQGAQLFVFADPATAADNADVLTLGGSDDPTNNRFGVHGNVVRVMSIILAPDPHTDDEAALLGCLPG